MMSRCSHCAGASSEARECCLHHFHLDSQQSEPVPSFESEAASSEAASSGAASKRQRLLAEYAEHKRRKALDPYSTGPYVPYHERRYVVGGAAATGAAGGKFKGEIIDVGYGPITMTPDPAGKPLLQEVLRLSAEFEESSARAYSSAAAKVTGAGGGESAPKKLRLSIDTGECRVVICVKADGTVADACAAAEAVRSRFGVCYFKRPIRTLALADGGLELNRTDMVSFIAQLGKDLSPVLFRPVYAED